MNKLTEKAKSLIDKVDFHGYFVGYKIKLVVVKHHLDHF